jgi:hypothetical protein
MTLNKTGEYKIQPCSQLKAFVCQRSECARPKLEFINAPAFVSFDSPHITAKPRTEADIGVWQINIKRTIGF